MEKFNATLSKSTRARKRKNATHAADMAVEQIIKTSEEKMNGTQLFQDVKLVPPALESKEYANDGH